MDWFGEHRANSALWCAPFKALNECIEWYISYKWRVPICVCAHRCKRSIHVRARNWYQVNIVIRVSLPFTGGKGTFQSFLPLRGGHFPSNTAQSDELLTVITKYSLHVVAVYTVWVCLFVKSDPVHTQLLYPRVHNRLSLWFISHFVSPLFEWGFTSFN